MSKPCDDDLKAFAAVLDAAVRKALTRALKPIKTQASTISIKSKPPAKSAGKPKRRK